jgi:hypothetical protein
MPSDAKKKQQQKKKEAAKARQAGRKATGNNKTENGVAEKEQSPVPCYPELNGAEENGTDVSIEGKSVNDFQDRQLGIGSFSTGFLNVSHFLGISNRTEHSRSLISLCPQVSRHNL